MTKKPTKAERHQELLADSTEYCCYCGTERHGFGCCGEMHYQTYAEMDKADQEDFLSQEDYEDEHTT